MADSEKQDKRIAYFDQRTLGLTTGPLTASEVSSAIKKLMIIIRIKFKITAYYHLAFVMSKNKITNKVESAGYCFLTVNRPEVYHLLCGRKLDGGENFDYVVDPKWIPPTEESEKSEEDDKGLFAITSWDQIGSFNMSWAEIMEEEEKIERKKINREPPKIKVLLPPILPNAVVKRQNDISYKIEITPSRVKVDFESPDYFEFNTNNIQGYFPNIIHYKEILNYFKPFSTSVNYPEVIETKKQGPNNIAPSRLVIIKFKPSSHDAMFVWQTHRRCVMIDKNGNRHTIFTSHPQAIDGK